MPPELLSVGRGYNSVLRHVDASQFPQLILRDGPIWSDRYHAIHAKNFRWNSERNPQPIGNRKLQIVSIRLEIRRA